MILPILEGFLSPLRAPMTWMILVLNFIFFGAQQVFFSEQMNQQQELQSKDFFLETQGQNYSQFILEDRQSHSLLMQTLAQQAQQGKRYSTQLIGQMASRDTQFLSIALNKEFSGDQVAISSWRKELRKLISLRSQHPNFLWGVSSTQKSISRFFTYQFLHGNWSHILLNMWFLMIFGCALEIEMGSIWFLSFYLLSGVAGAFAFLLLSGASAAPLVGASASISGLMGYYFWSHRKRSARFLYWLLPIEGYFGFIYLPVLASLGVWFLLDLASYLATLPELGGVAHAAHMGGFAFGIISAFLFLLFSRSKSTAHGVFSNTTGLHKL